MGSSHHGGKFAALHSAVTFKFLNLKLKWKWRFWRSSDKLKKVRNVIILPPKACFPEAGKSVHPVRAALLNDAERSRLRCTSSLLSGHGSVVPNPGRND